MKHFNHAAEFLAFIAKELGAAPDDIAPGETRRFSTNGRPTDKAGACLMFGDGLGGVCTDFRLGVSKVWLARDLALTGPQRKAYAHEVMLAKAQRAQAEQARWAENARFIAGVQAKCKPVSAGDPVMQYFHQRGISGPMPACLRLHTQLEYYGDGVEGYFPAMVAPLVTPDGRTVALHRTYLTHQGAKAPVVTPKKLTPKAARLEGSCIPLRSAQEGVLGIAEGIETSQATYLKFGVPTVAAYCAGNLRKFAWPAALRRLVIFADHDPVGEHAAFDLAQRARHCGLSAEIVIPEQPEEDWCDVWSKEQELKLHPGEGV